jgi:hypothetical protein
MSGAGRLIVWLSILILGISIYANAEDLPSASTEPSPKSQSTEEARSTPQISSELRRILDSKMVAARRLAEDPLLIKAVMAQNQSGMSLEEIKRHDTDWQTGQNMEFQERVLSSNASLVLRKRVRSNKQIYGEAFACDRQGALVGAFPRTSDYWQGDEEKFSACYNQGVGQEHIGEIAYDESVGSYLIQVSVPIYSDVKGTDGSLRETIGVLVVGLKDPVSAQKGTPE